MYFAIAYEIWPRLTGREHASLAPLRLQLWLWFIGMMVMTLPWHWLGLQGQWRRVANFNYADPIIAGWGPWVIVSFVGRHHPACLGAAVRQKSARAASWSCCRCRAAALRACRPPAATRPGRAQRLRLVERAGAGADAGGLRLSDCAVPDRAVARARSCTGCNRSCSWQTSRTAPSEPHVLDQPWRIWSSIAVLGILLSRHFARRAYHSGGAGTERRARSPTPRFAGRSASFPALRRSRSLPTERRRRPCRR